MNEENPKFVRGASGETIYSGDRVLDTRPHGTRGTVTGVVNESLVTVRFGVAAYDITVAGRHLSRVTE